MSTRCLACDALWPCDACQRVHEALILAKPVQRRTERENDMHYDLTQDLSTPEGDIA